MANSGNPWLKAKMCARNITKYSLYYIYVYFLKNTKKPLHGSPMKCSYNNSGSDLYPALISHHLQYSCIIVLLYTVLWRDLTICNFTSQKTRTCPSDYVNTGMASDKHKSNLIIPPTNKSWEVIPVWLSLCLSSLYTCITLIIYTHNTLQGFISEQEDCRFKCLWCRKSWNHLKSCSQHDSRIAKSWYFSMNLIYEDFSQYGMGE